MTPGEKLAALNALLKRCKKAPFYREKLPERELRSLSELKQIPLTTKEQLRRCSPYDLVCVPRKELYQYHESFGTTGTPVSTWLTKEDFKFNARHINTGGINFSKEDVVLVRFPYAISTIAHYVHRAAQLKGACVIPASSRSTVSPFTRIIHLMQKLEVTILACLPLQALLLAETAELLGFNPAKDFPNLRAIFTAGEPLTDGKRKLLESIWKVQIINNYGMTETGSQINDCEFCRPHPDENSFIYEILKEDLQTDAEPGETGYLVVTTLNKEATPLIRYLTGDRAKLIHEECPCGKEKVIEIRGRMQNTIKVGRRVLDQWDLDDLVSLLPYRRFWIAGPGTRGVKFVIEKENCSGTLSAHFIRKLEQLHEVPLEVEIVPKGTLLDRSKLLSVGRIGKPRYIYTAAEMQQKTYLKAEETKFL
ncbi:MAG: phenylacetate--CoA ligase family protein [Thermoanaerobacteraceae bacterium]|nr:phenylacetate--CoA ligase family protein [Thermoanaerobacteraceae bacterium]